MTVRTYSPDQVITIVGGIPMSGFADGTFVTIDEMADGVTSTSGADGEVARAMSTDRRSKVTITLQQTSVCNAALTAIYVADRVSGGRGIVPLLIEDLSGGEVFTAGEAWIDKMPSRGHGKEISNREWTITAVPASLSTVLGNS